MGSFASRRVAPSHSDEEAQKSFLGSSSREDSFVKEPEALQPEAPQRCSSSTSKEEFLQYCRRFACLGIWCGLLIVNFWWSRFFVLWGNLPSDGDAHEDAYDVYYSLTHMLFYGVVLAWFAGLTEPTHAAWLLHWRRWYFYALFFGVSPIYSAISDTESLQHSFQDTAEWSGAMWTAMAIVGIVSGSIVIWHLYYAYKKLSSYGVALYLAVRVVVILYYGMFATLVQGTHHSDVHLHHYFTAWMVALFAEFDHPLSVVLLGSMSSVFVQGIASYGFDPLFNDDTCRSMHVTNYGTCTYTANGEFQMEMCPGKRDDVTIKCFTRSTNQADLTPWTF